MDPIRNKPVTPPTQPVTPPVTQTPDVAKAGPTFNVGSSTPASGAAQVQATSATTSMPSANSVESIRKHIAVAARNSTDHASLVRNVIHASVDERFGKLATPQLKQRVADTLSNDPNFMSMINRLVQELGPQDKA